MICKKCGFDCNDGMMFCPNCGAELKKEPENVPSGAADTAYNAYGASAAEDRTDIEFTQEEDSDRTELLPEDAPPPPPFPQPQYRDTQPQPQQYNYPPQYRDTQPQPQQYRDTQPQPQYASQPQQYRTPQPQYADQAQPQYASQPRQQYPNQQQPYGSAYGQQANPYGQAPQAGNAGAPYRQPMHSSPAAGAGIAVHRALKEVGSSPVVLLAAIFMAVSILLGIVGQAVTADDPYEMLEDLFYEYDIDVPDELFSTDTGTAVVTAVISAVPNILIAIGVFVVFASAKSKTEPTLGTGGLTLINVMIAIGLGVICVLALLVIVIMLMGSAALSFIGGAVSSFEGSEYVGTAFAIVIAVFAVVFAFVISYYICLIRTVGAIKKTAHTGVPEIRGSAMYITVLDFIFGSSTILGAISSVLGGNFIGALGNIFSGTAVILFGVALIKYRSRMKSVSAAAPAAAYGQPPVTVCSRCGAQYPANLPTCPRCGMPKNMYR